MEKRVTVGMPGIFKTPNPDAHTLSNNPPDALKARVADFSYSNDALAQMIVDAWVCLLYTSPSPRDGLLSRMPSSA